MKQTLKEDKKLEKTEIKNEIDIEKIELKSQDPNKSEKENRRDKIMYVYNNRDTPAIVKKECREWLKKNENDLFFMAHLAEALWYGTKDEVTEAKDLADFILKQEPKDGDDICALIRIYGLQENYEKFSQLAELGVKENHPICMCHMAWCYNGGKGVTKDVEKSNYYYQLAIDNNGPLLAYYNLGVQLDSDGRYDEARKLYLKSAKLGYKSSIAKLQGLYSKDLESKESFEYHDMICNIQGYEPDAVSLYNLGYFYFYGKFVDRDLTKSRLYWESGKKKGNNDCVQAIKFMDDNKNLY